MHRLGGVWSSCGGHPALHVGGVPLAAAGPPVHRSGLCQRSRIRHLPAAPTTVRAAACPRRAPTLDNHSKICAAFTFPSVRAVLSVGHPPAGTRTTHPPPVPPPLLDPCPQGPLITTNLSSHPMKRRHAPTSHKCGPVRKRPDTKGRVPSRGQPTQHSEAPNNYSAGRTHPRRAPKTKFRGRNAACKDHAPVTGPPNLSGQFVATISPPPAFRIIIPTTSISYGNEKSYFKDTIACIHLGHSDHSSSPPSLHLFNCNRTNSQIHRRHNFPPVASPPPDPGIPSGRLRLDLLFGLYY